MQQNNIIIFIAVAAEKTDLNTILKTTFIEFSVIFKHIHLWVKMFLYIFYCNIIFN